MRVNKSKTLNTLNNYNKIIQEFFSFPVNQHSQVEQQSQVEKFIRLCSKFKGKNKAIFKETTRLS